MTSSKATKINCKPILFSGPMVRAILDGRKTQTRRIMKQQPELDRGGLLHANFGIKDREGGFLLLDANHDGRFAETCKCCPYGSAGDRLWVRETFFCVTGEPGPIDCRYQADYAIGDFKGLWKPSIHMPRWASRITLEITGVRVERLQDISEVDAIAEGVAETKSDYEICQKDGRVPVIQFARLWQSINGSDSWAVNPWVWVIEFRRVEK